MIKQTWECIITRQLKIERPDMEFKDYTDWLSDATSGRLNPIDWGDFILDCVSKTPICTVNNENITEVKRI